MIECGVRSAERGVIGARCGAVILPPMPASKPTTPVHITHACRHHPSHARYLATLATRIYREQKTSMQARTEIILCSDRVIRTLNRRFRHKDKPTDVLSFTYNDPDLLGEIYVSVDRAAVQARRFGHSYRDELARLVTHGMFHLLGYDHHTVAERAKMESMERRYVSL
jgi:probable rRNA maturation factor